jgi:SAM-dependent methyltransferase
VVSVYFRAVLDLERYDRAESKRHYDEAYVADDFRQFPVATRHFLRAFVRHHDVPAAADGLDLGCGTGGFVECLSDVDVNAVGIDISEVGVAAASDAHPDESFVVGDALNLPFPERSFDLVTANGFPVFGESDLASARPFVEELLHYLRDDGLLLVGHTSRLDDEEHGSWANHSMTAFDRLFDPVDATVVGRYAVIPHLFIPLGEHAFSPRLTALLRWSARTFGHPVRPYYALEPVR